MNQTLPPPLVAAIAGYAVNPAAATARASDWLQTHPHAPYDAEALARLCGYGSFLPACVRRIPALAHPDIVARLRRGDAAAALELAQQAHNNDPAADLRLRRIAAYGAVGLAQIAGWWPPDLVWTTLSRIADHLINMAYHIARAELVARFGECLAPDGNPNGLAILAFGKLGSCELNFSSDVDLVMVGRSNAGESCGGDEPGIEAPVFLERLARRTIRLLDDLTEHGFVFRVDLRLRPDGSRGRLVPAAEAFVEYYPTFAASWERVALLRARAAAGDIELGERLLQSLEAYVFPRHLDYEAIEDMRLMKDKIDREATRRTGGDIDLKLGHGGIRELEFLVQNLAIVFGGRRPELRVRGTLEALTALRNAEVVPQTVAEALADAYRFLRHVENVVQCRDDRQTYILPDNHTRDEIARAAGFATASNPRAALESRLETVRALVAHEFGLLYQRPEEDTKAIRSEVFELIENDELDDSSRTALLQALGFAAPAQAVSRLQRLIAGPKASVYGSRTREQFERALPAILDAVAATADPDQALALMQEFIYRIGGRPYLHALLRENPQIIRVLAQHFADSLLLGRLFIRNPHLLDALVLRSHAEPERTSEAIAALVANAGADADLETAMDSLRMLRSQEILRIGWHDLSGALSLESVQRQLSDLAAAIVDRTVDLAFTALRQRGGIDPAWCRDLLPVALGKLGSGEMNYLSDLDLIFLTPPNSELPNEHAIRWAQRTITLLAAKTAHGSCYEVDTRLRPSGNQGLLVSSFAAFQRYHQHQAAIWERVALVKRRILGKHPSAEAVAAEIARICFATPLTSADIDEMARIRERMVAERGAGEPFKTGIGGTADIEVATALVQLRYGGEYAPLTDPNPARALAAFSLLPQPFPELAQTFRQALATYRRLEQRLHLLLDRPLYKLPDDPARRASLAIGLGYADVDALEAAFAHLATDVRSAYDRCLAALHNP